MAYEDGFGRFGHFPRTGPRPVEGGIKARSRRGNIGETWWSRRFIQILESFGFGSRLARGRSYARRGQVAEISVDKGVVEARVQGSRPRPYQVRLTVEPLSDQDWARAEQAMAAKALFMASLLAGEMPKDIEQAFTESSLTLFPASGRELASACSCPDWAIPCKHVAAVYYILAESFDADPFLVFSWRGRTKEELIERLRALRGAVDSRPNGGLAAIAAPPGSSPPLRACLGSFWQAGPELAEVAIRPWAAEAPDALVRQLGPPPVRVRGEDVAGVLADAYQAMSSAAERRALGEDGG